MRCRSLLLVGPGELAWVEEGLPHLRPDALLVRTDAGAISIGSELPVYRGIARTTAPVTYPRMTGYESVGTVLACGAAVQRFHPGDRVAAFYGHRTHAAVPEGKVIPVPDGMPDELALLSILSCDVAKGVRRLAPSYDEAVLVTGAGTIGLLAVFVLRAVGVRAVDVVEPQPQRRALARRLGARAAVSPDEGAVDATYDAGLECSSRNAAFALLQSRLRHGGRLCILADGNLEPLLLAPEFHAKELSVAGSSDGWDYQRHAAWYFDLVRREAPPLGEIFDHRIAAEDLADTFAALARGTLTATKVLVRYHGAPV